MRADDAGRQLDEHIGRAVLGPRVHPRLGLGAAFVVAQPVLLVAPHRRIAHDQPDHMLAIIGAGAENLARHIGRVDLDRVQHRRVGKVGCGCGGFALRQRGFPVGEHVRQ